MSDRKNGYAAGTLPGNDRTSTAAPPSRVLTASPSKLSGTMLATPWYVFISYDNELATNTA
jgi:hypothetical protein